jgi:hypothetical protein
MTGCSKISWCLPDGVVITSRSYTDTYLFVTPGTVATVFRLSNTVLTIQLIYTSTRTTAVHSGAVWKFRCQLAVVAKPPQSKFGLHGSTARE